MNTSPRAKKKLGQHFLTDTNIISRIINALNPHPEDTVIEIGPGQGALTAQLIQHVKRLIAIEFDRDLIPLLDEKFKGVENFLLIEDDALKVNYRSLILPEQNAKLVANLPYNISTAILQRLIKHRECVPEMVLMLQREVVDRMLAPAGSSERGYLSVLIQFYYQLDLLFDVAPGCFHPPPKVWSSVVRLCTKLNKDTSVDDALLWTIVSAGFAQKRKTILNNLKSSPPILKTQIEKIGGSNRLLQLANIDSQRRAETLTLEDWATLASLLKPVSM
jgi:16S rRNA (adenine1518-N6/adenine1519-N6)-dimethyltransferase